MGLYLQSFTYVQKNDVLIERFEAHFKSVQWVTSFRKVDT